MAHDRFSYSRLQAFDQCPAQYRFHYLEEIPESGVSIESYLGNRLHQSLEWLYSERRTGRNVLFDDLLAIYRNLWRDHWSAAIRIADMAWTTDDYYQLGIRCLAGYFRRYAPFDQPVEGTEVTLSFNLSGDDSYPIKAVLDRLDNHGDGWWSIHDYKSGKRMITSAKAEEDLQMKIYYLGLKETESPITRVDVAWHFLRHGKDVVLEDVEWNQQRIAAMLKKRIDKIREQEQDSQNMPPRESMLCHWCYYWDTCPAKKGQDHPTRPAD